MKRRSNRTHRKRRSTKKQRGGQPRLPVFEAISEGVSVPPDPAVEEAIQAMRQQPLPALQNVFPRVPNTLNLGFLNTYAPAPEPAPVPNLRIPEPRPIEQVPPSSLEFQIFFTEFHRLVVSYRISPREISEFVIALADLTRNLSLNSEEVLRVLTIYEDLLQNGIRSVSMPLQRHVTYLKRTGRL